MEVSCGGTKAVRSGTGLFIQVTNLAIRLSLITSLRVGKGKVKCKKAAHPPTRVNRLSASRPWNRECRKSLIACQLGSSLRTWFPEKKGLEGSLEQRCSQQ